MDTILIQASYFIIHIKGRRSRDYRKYSLETSK
nr:MAG TPA: hypothetical protein [Bacteriophage sp.]